MAGARSATSPAGPATTGVCVLARAGGCGARHVLERADHDALYELARRSTTWILARGPAPYSVDRRLDWAELRVTTSTGRCFVIIHRPSAPAAVRCWSIRKDTAVSIEVTEDTISSDFTRQSARRARPAVWQLSWLPGHRLSRDQAMYGMMIAELIAQVHDEARSRRVGFTHRLWPEIDQCAAELGMTGADAVVRLVGALAEEPANDEYPRWLPPRYYSTRAVGSRL